jgi:hypothetical protein
MLAYSDGAPLSGDVGESMITAINSEPIDRSSVIQPRSKFISVVPFFTSIVGIFQAPMSDGADDRKM